MLQKQHRFSSRIKNHTDRRVYRTHMCGLCHALGDRYGLLSRLLTNQEMILLNMLTSAQQSQELEVIQRRCPLNPTRFVNTNQDVSSAFAAAVAVELAKVSVEDDIQDSHGRDVIAHGVNWLLRRPHKKAQHHLTQLGFETDTFRQLTVDQTTIERDLVANPSEPSAVASACLFAMTAQLAGCPQNTPNLAAIGANYGAFLYWMDAYVDFVRDMVQDTFNPLKHFHAITDDAITISSEGLKWLHGQFASIEALIRENLSQIKLYRYADTLHLMLLQPVQKIMREIDHQLHHYEDLDADDFDDYQEQFGHQKRKRVQVNDNSCFSGDECCYSATYCSGDDVSCLCHGLDACDGSPDGCDGGDCSPDGCEGGSCD